MSERFGLGLIHDVWVIYTNKYFNPNTPSLKLFFFILGLYFCYTSVILLLYFCYTSLTLPPSILTFGLYSRRGCAGPVLSVWFIIFWVIYTSFNTRCSRDLSWIKYFNSTTILSTFSFLFLDYSSVTHLLTILRTFLPSVYIDGGGARVRFYPFDSSCSRDLSWFNTRCSRDLYFCYTNKYFNSTTILSTYSFLFLVYTSVTHLLTILRLFLPSVYFHGADAPVRFYSIHHFLRDLSWFDSSCSRDLYE